MTLLQMSFSGAILILVIIALRAVAVNRLPKKMFLALWGIVVLRLLLPFSVPSMFSVYSLIGRNDTVYDSIAETPAVNLIPGSLARQLTPDDGTAQVIQNDTSVFFWSIIWCAGMILCAVFFIFTYMRCRLEFQISFPVDNNFATDWLEEHPLKRTISIRQSGRILAPLTYGIFHPVILMPKKTDWGNVEQLRYILLHEYIHICSYDAVKKLILVIALCIHWFNPMVWVMYILCNRDVELACDERVVRSFGQDSKAIYAGTLISMEERKSHLTPLCNNFSRNAIEERVKAIMKTKKVTCPIVIVCAAVIIVILILFATSMKKDAKSVGDFDVPKVVLEQAQEWVAQKYSYEISRSDMPDWYYNDYTDWRIENLEHSYTYDAFEGMELEIYNMNYEFLAASPENVQLIGGMYMTDDGWVMPGYPNSIYLIFEKSGKNLVYLTVIGENDCIPGDEVFTGDLSAVLKH